MRHACSLVASLLLMCQARPSFAWKPITHVHLAQEAWEDAKDGKVTLHRVDYETGSIGESLGEFEVHPDLLAAIRAYPASYFAGVLGPDAYPDMVTGQMRVHPPGRGASTDPDLNENGPGTPPWLRKLWTLAFTRESSPQVQAFVAGYLAHAAGDVYAHTYVNGYTGGIFDLTNTNGLKHTILEGYIEQRTPRLRPIADRRSANRDPFVTVATLGVRDGVDGFIARNTAEIDCPRCANEDARLMSLPWHFVQIRDWLAGAIVKYERTERELRGPLGDWIEILADVQARFEWSCDMTKHAACPVEGGTPESCPGLDNRRANVFWCGVESTKLAALTLASSPIEPALAAWRTYTTTLGPMIRHARGWRSNIDRGLVRWVQTNHRIAMHLFYNPTGMNMEQAMAEIKAFAPIAAAMLTGIDVDMVVRIQDALNLAKAPLDAVKGRIDAIKADFYEKAFRALIGTTPEELKRKYASSHAFVDPMFGTGTQLRLNRSMQLPESADDDFTRGQPITRFDWRKFPAAYNTVTLIKLSLLAPAEVNRLYRTLAALPPAARQPTRMHHLSAPPDNIMLGWGHTIDGSNQWLLGMPLADHGCVLYRRVFHRIPPGPSVNERGSLHPAEPDDDCTPTGLPMLAVDKLHGILAPGGRFTLQVSEDAIVETNVGSATRCTVAGKPCNVTITAPQTDVPLDLVVTVKPKLDNPRRPPIDVVLEVQPELAIEVVEPANAQPSEIVAPGGTLRPGQRVTLEVTPSTDVTWTLEGPGKLLAPARAEPVAATATERAIDTQRRVLAKCKAAACIQRSQTKIGKLAAKLTLAGQSVATSELAANQRVYVAPAKPSRRERAIIRVRSADGRTAKIELALRQAPLPLRLANPNPTVKAGQLVQLQVEPPVPVTWSLAPGAVGEIGEVGTPERKKLEQDIAPLQQQLLKVRVRDPRIATVSRVPATPSPVRVTPTPSPARVSAPAAPARAVPMPTARAAALEVDRLVHADVAKRAGPMRELLKLASTYRAPTRVARPTTVIVTGTVQDGTGRKLTARIRVRP